MSAEKKRLKKNFILPLWFQLLLYCQRCSGWIVVVRIVSSFRFDRTYFSFPRRFRIWSTTLFAMLSWYGVIVLSAVSTYSQSGYLRIEFLPSRRSIKSLINVTITGGIRGRSIWVLPWPSEVTWCSREGPSIQLGAWVEKVLYLSPVQFEEQSLMIASENILRLTIAFNTPSWELLFVVEGTHTVIFTFLFSSTNLGTGCLLFYFLNVFDKHLVYRHFQNIPPLFKCSLRLSISCSGYFLEWRSLCLHEIVMLNIGLICIV